MHTSCDLLQYRIIIIPNSQMIDQFIIENELSIAVIDLHLNSLSHRNDCLHPRGKGLLKTL